MEKEYLALVRGLFPADGFTHTSILSSHITQNVAVPTKDLESTTEFKLVQYYPKSV